MLFRPDVRDKNEEQVFTKELIGAQQGIHATRLAPPTTTEDDAATKQYVESLGLTAATLNGTTASHHTQNKRYVDSIGIFAVRIAFHRENHSFCE